MKKSMLIAIALVVLVVASAAGFVLTRSRYLAPSTTLSTPGVTTAQRQEPGYFRWGHRRAVEGKIVAWETGRALLEAQTATYTVFISQHTRVVRRTPQYVGAKAIVLGRSQDAAINAFMVILLPPEPRPAQ